MTKHRYDLELNNDTHWGLVKLAAEIRMHQEDYAEQVLKAHVEECCIDKNVDQQTTDTVD